MNKINSVVLSLVAIVVVLSPSWARAQEGDRRLALVVGVSDYGRQTLPNAVSDAKLMEGALTQTGFKVTRLDNPTRGALRAAVTALYEEAEAGSANTTIVFYYAGHAIQLGRENWLIPSGSGLLEGRPTRADFEDSSVSAGWILGKLREAGVARVMFILDACRNDPFPQTTLPTEQGLAVMDVAAGGGDTLILFSAEPGRTASDGPAGRNSPFALALAETIVLPEMSVSEVVDQVRSRVARETQTAPQRPYAVGSLPFQFRPARAQSTLAGVVGEARIRELVDGRVLLDAVLENQTLDSIRQAADEGDAFALYLMGMAYWDGAGGVEKSRARALHYIRRSAARGFARAANALGTLYYGGDGLEAVPGESMAWYEIAIELGNVSAINNIGVTYRDNGDIDRAVEYFTRAGESGYALAWSNLGWVYGTHRYGRFDPRLAFENHQRAYAAGYLEATIDLAQAYQWGTAEDGTVKNPDRAVTLLVEAGEQGCVTCWAAAAGIYTTDAFGEPDPTMSYALYRRGAEAGDSTAMLESGRALAAGRGVEKDTKEALAWYERGSALGNLEATGQLGRLLAQGGDGLPRDPQRAEPLLRQMVRLDYSPDPSVRHQVYAPNYWAFATALANLIDDGLVQPSYPAELADLRARYGGREGTMKRFTVPIDCGGISSPFHVYIMDWDRPNDETIEDQVEWVTSQRGCTFPVDVQDSFRRLRAIARENDVSFEDLVVYALGAAQTEATTTGVDASPGE